jgi:ubiquitin C-terminal hydrolase
MAGRVRGMQASLKHVRSDHRYSYIYTHMYIHKGIHTHATWQVVCAACKHRSNTYDPTIDLSLEIANCQSLTDCFERYTNVETLGSSNAYACDQCKQKTRATKRLTLHTLPNVLILHLKRFDFWGMHGGKISKFIRYPRVSPVCMCACMYVCTCIYTCIRMLRA